MNKVVARTAGEKIAELLSRAKGSKANITLEMPAKYQKMAKNSGDLSVFMEKARISKVDLNTAVNPAGTGLNFDVIAKAGEEQVASVKANLESENPQSLIDAIVEIFGCKKSKYPKLKKLDFEFKEKPLPKK